MFQKRLQFFRSLLYLGDLIIVAVSWIAAYFIRFFVPIIPVTKGVPDLNLYLALLILVLLVFAVVLRATGVYRRPWSRGVQDAGKLLRAGLIGVVVAVTITYFVRPYVFSRLVFMHFFVLFFLSSLLYRPILRWAWTRMSPGQSGESTLILGGEELGSLVAAKLTSNPLTGFRISGFLTRREELVGSKLDGIPVLGRFEDLPQVLERHQINTVIIALPLEAHDRIQEILERLADELVDVLVVPDIFRYLSLNTSVEEFDGLPIIGLRSSPLQGWARILKRMTDIAGAILAIAVFLPVMGVVALAVRITSPGPVIYRQERMGLDGRVFDMIKFRSMQENAEKECGPAWASCEDPRRTRFGAFIRRTSLDELPQFFNVLRGEMSLVGPRPERPEFIRDFKGKIPLYMARHKMKAGITGWAQINGWRGNTSVQRRIEHDLYYIENWSLSLDFKIMLLTLVRGFTSPHAY